MQFSAILRTLVAGGGGDYPSGEVQLAYSIAPADRAGNQKPKVCYFYMLYGDLIYTCLTSALAQSHTENGFVNYCDFNLLLTAF